MEGKLTLFEQKIVDTFLEVMQTSKNGEGILLASPELACQMMTEAVVALEMDNASRQGFKFHEQTSPEADILANLERLFLSDEEANITLARQIIIGFAFSQTSLLTFLHSLYEKRFKNVFSQRKLPFIASFKHISNMELLFEGDFIDLLLVGINKDAAINTHEGLRRMKTEALNSFIIPIFLSS